MDKRSILIVEDEGIVAEDLKKTLTSFGYRVTGIASTGERAIECVNADRPDLILMDINLGLGIDGIEAAERINSSVYLPVIYLTAYADLEFAERAKATLPYGYLLKPYNSRELQSTIEIAFLRLEKDDYLKRVHEELKQIYQNLQESEERYRTLFQNNPTMLFTLDPDGKVISANEFGARQLGYTSGELKGQSVLKVIYPEDHPRMVEQLQVCLKSPGEIFHWQLRKVKKDGSLIWVDEDARAMPGSAGELSVLVVCHDITMRKQIEHALQESEERYRNVVEDQTEFICRFTPDGTLTFVNAAYCRYFQLIQEECIGSRHSVILPPDVLQKMKRHLSALTRENPAAYIIHRIIMPSGEERWHRWSDRAIFNKDGEVIEYQSVGRDITERIHAEEILRKTKEYLENLIRYANGPIIVWNSRFEITEVNPAFEVLAGLHRDEVIGQSLSVLFTDESREQSLDLFRQTLTGERLETVEIPIRHISGDTYIVLWNSANVLDSGGTVIATIAQGQDITLRKRVEKALQEREELFREVFNNANDAMFLNEMRPDGLGPYILVNEIAIRCLGYTREELLGTSPQDSMPVPVFQEFMPASMKKLIEDGYATFESVYHRKDGSDYPVEVSTHAFLLQGKQVALSIVRDITERKKVEAELKKYHENLEKIVEKRTSELTIINIKLKKENEERKKVAKKLTISANEKDLLLREVHHRVKNNLQLISGLIDITKMRTHDPPVIATLTDIMAKVHTMGLIHTRLYESKRFDRVNMKDQINDLVETISGFYDHDHLDIVTKINCTEIYIPVDIAIPCALALNETFSNIHKHAFQGRRHGIIDISSTLNDEMLRFVIKDNGVGLPKGFDIEKSNRLGLKLIRALVEQQLHGTVEIKSKKGTQVIIQFPVHQGEINFGTSINS
jgi:PAS domain S-box-containing protein